MDFFSKVSSFFLSNFRSKGDGDVQSSLADKIAQKYINKMFCDEDLLIKLGFPFKLQNSEVTNTKIYQSGNDSSQNSNKPVIEMENFTSEIFPDLFENNEKQTISQLNFVLKVNFIKLSFLDQNSQVQFEFTAKNCVFDIDSESQNQAMLEDFSFSSSGKVILHIPKLDFQFQNNFFFNVSFSQIDVFLSLSILSEYNQVFEFTKLHTNFAISISKLNIYINNSTHFQLNDFSLNNNDNGITLSSNRISANLSSYKFILTGFSYDKNLLKVDDILIDETMKFFNRNLIHDKIEFLEKGKPFFQIINDPECKKIEISDFRLYTTPSNFNKFRQVIHENSFVLYFKDLLNQYQTYDINSTDFEIVFLYEKHEFLNHPKISTLKNFLTQEMKMENMNIESKQQASNEFDINNYIRITSHVHFISHRTEESHNIIFDKMSLKINDNPPVYDKQMMHFSLMYHQKTTEIMAAPLELYLIGEEIPILYLFLSDLKRSHDFNNMDFLPSINFPFIKCYLCIQINNVRKKPLFQLDMKFNKIELVKEEFFRLNLIFETALYYKNISTSKDDCILDPCEIQTYISLSSSNKDCFFLFKPMDFTFSIDQLKKFKQIIQHQKMDEISPISIINDSEKPIEITYEYQNKKSAQKITINPQKSYDLTADKFFVHKKGNKLLTYSVNAIYFPFCAWKNCIVSSNTDELNRKIIRFTSYVIIENRLSIKLSLWLKSFIKKQKIVDISPKSKTPLPLLESSDAYILCKDEQYASGAHSIEINTTERKQFIYLIPGQDNNNYPCCITIFQDILTKSTIFLIEPTLTVKSLMDQDIHFMLSCPESKSVNQDIVTLHPSESVKFPLEKSMLNEINLHIYELGAHSSVNTKKISMNSPDQMQYINISNKTLAIKTETLNDSQKITIFSEVCMVNETTKPLTLIVQENKSKTAPINKQIILLPKTESLLPIPPNCTRQQITQQQYNNLMNSTTNQTSTLLTKEPTKSLQQNDTTNSQNQSELNTGIVYLRNFYNIQTSNGMTPLMVIPSTITNKQQIEIDKKVSINAFSCLTNYDSTMKVVFKDMFVIENNSKHDIEIINKETNEIQTIKPQKSSPLLIDKTGEKCIISINHELFTRGTLLFNCPCSTTLNLLSEDGDKRLLLDISSEIIDDIVVTTISDSNYPPKFMISNQTNFLLFAQQLEDSMPLQVLPHSSSIFGFDIPSSTMNVIITIEGISQTIDFSETQFNSEFSKSINSRWIYAYIYTLNSGTRILNVGFDKFVSPLVDVSIRFKSFPSLNITLLRYDMVSFAGIRLEDIQLNIAKSHISVLSKIAIQKIEIDDHINNSIIMKSTQNNFIDFAAQFATVPLSLNTLTQFNVSIGNMEILAPESTIFSLLEYYNLIKDVFVFQAPNNKLFLTHSVIDSTEVKVGIESSLDKSTRRIEAIQNYLPLYATYNLKAISIPSFKGPLPILTNHIKLLLNNLITNTKYSLNGKPNHSIKTILPASIAPGFEQHKGRGEEIQFPSLDQATLSFSGFPTEKQTQQIIKTRINVKTSKQQDPKIAEQELQFTINNDKADIHKRKYLMNIISKQNISRNLLKQFDLLNNSKLQKRGILKAVFPHKNGSLLIFDKTIVNRDSGKEFDYQYSVVKIVTKTQNQTTVAGPKSKDPTFTLTFNTDEECEIVFHVLLSIYEANKRSIDHNKIL